jgi:hypothetical protein
MRRLRPRVYARGTALLLAWLTVAACSGSSDGGTHTAGDGATIADSGVTTGSDASGKLGSASTGGSTGADARADMAASSTPVRCPEHLPRAGQVCAENGMRCGYTKGCVAHQVTCLEGEWVAHTGGLMICPRDLPQTGTSCDCFITCRYDRCFSDSPELLAASCNGPGTTWSIAAEACPDGG